MLEKSMKQSVSRSQVARKENMILGCILSMLCISVFLCLGIVLFILIVGHGKSMQQLEDHYD